MNEFNVKFGIIGIDHRHVYTQAQFLVELGAELVGWYTDGSPTTLEGFTKRFPKAKRFTDSRSLLEDQDIQVILTSAIPSERAKISISAMNHGKDVMSDKPGCLSYHDLEELRETVRKQMIVQRVQRGRVANEIDITEKEFDTYLKNDDSLVSLEPELLVRQILVKTISDANIAIEQINNGKNFEVLAREISIAGDKDNAGLMEWRKAFNMPKLFSDAIKNMPVGYISSPLKSGAGYHILKLEQKSGDFVQYEDQ